ncbi:MAG: phosphotransferase family protein [Ktedonobacteraceae bacterium]
MEPAECIWGILATIHHQPFPSDFQSDRNLECAEYNFLHYNTEDSAELLDQLRQHRPLPIPSTLIHGDFTVDNVLILDGKVTGIIDWAGGGVGDPRYDLALAIRPKETNLFHVLEDRQAFFEGYGLFNLSDFDYTYFVDLYEFF